MIDKYLTKEEKVNVINFLLVLFMFFFFAFLFLIIVLPGIRSANKPHSLPESLSTSLNTGWLDPTDYPPLKQGEASQLNFEEVFNPSKKVIEEGENLYRIYCVSCHGEKGEGDGIGATNMQPPPRNFKRHNDFKNGANLIGIYKTISSGIPNSSMASYEYLSKYNRIALAIKVMRLGNIENVKNKDNENFITNLFAQSEPLKIKIPYSFAKKILIEENEDLTKKDDVLSCFERDAILDKKKATILLSCIRKTSKTYSDLKKNVLFYCNDVFSYKVIFYSDREWQTIFEKLKEGNK